MSSKPMCKESIERTLRRLSKWKCEVSQDTPCVWNQIYDQLDTQQLLKTMETIVPPKDWTTGMENHPRRMVLEHLVMKK